MVTQAPLQVMMGDRGGSKRWLGLAVAAAVIASRARADCNEIFYGDGESTYLHTHTLPMPDTGRKESHQVEFSPNRRNSDRSLKIARAYLYL